MKSFSTSLLLLLLIVTLTASYAQKGNATITGIVKDSVTQMPVEFANVALATIDNETPIDGAVCDMDGKFQINKVAPGEYRLFISFIGFETKTIKVSVEDKRDDVELGAVIISPTPQVLKEITVEGQRAIIEEKVDRTVYNAENDATAKGGDATDVLKRVPMLSVDLDGNVSLRGNQNITVLINNKPSSIMASNVADALKQIPADQIKSVEVITSPSAKYDAEGSAGIINIITKKNNLEGATLNVDSGIGLRGSNLGLNGNFRRGKMGFSLGGWGRANYNVRGNFFNEQQRLNATTGAPEATTSQNADTRNSGLFGHYNLGWDYDINKKNLLAASVRFGVRNWNNYQDDLLSRTVTSTLDTTILSDVMNNDKSNNIDASLIYTHYYDKPQRELSVQGLYSRNNRVGDFRNFYKDIEDLSVSERFKNINNSYNQEMTAQVDYVTPILNNQQLELGAKNINRSVISDFETFVGAGTDGAYIPSASSELNNNLNYSQNVAAGYASYLYTTKSDLSFKVGTRYEYTTIKAFTETQSEADFNIPSYGVLVPSINVSRKLKNGNTIKASYNRRIQRPSIRFLNPNRQWQNGQTAYSVGNPELDPEYTNNYELGYSTFIKGIMLNLTAFARNTNGGIQSVRDIVEGEDGQPIFRTTFQNIGYENAYGTSIFANVNIGKLSLNGGGDIYYADLNNNNPDPIYQASNAGVVFSGRVFGSYNLNKGWGFQFFSFYRGKQVQLQGYQTGWYMYSLAIRKEFNEKRGSIGLGLENFLQKSVKMRSQLESPILLQNSVNEMFNSSVRLNISYRIGKMSVDPPRRRRSINNDDLKDGGGDGMGGGMGNDQPRSGGGGFSPGRSGGNKSAAPTPTVTPDTSAVTYSPVGKWDFTVDSPQGGSGTISLNENNGVFTGTITTNRMPKETELSNITIDKNDVSFSYPVNFGGNTNTITVKYRVNDESIEGTMSVGQFGTFPIKGNKKE